MGTGLQRPRPAACLVQSHRTHQLYRVSEVHMTTQSNGNKPKQPNGPDRWSELEHITIRIMLFIIMLIGIFKLLAHELKTLPAW